MTSHHGLDPLNATLQAASPHFDDDVIRATATELGFLAARPRDAHRRLLEGGSQIVWARRALATRHGDTTPGARFIFVAQHAGAGWGSMQPVIARLRERGEGVTVAATASVLREHRAAIEALRVGLVSLDRVALRSTLLPDRASRRAARDAWRRLRPALEASGVPATPLARHFRALAARYAAYRGVFDRLLAAHPAVMVNHADFTVPAAAAIDAARAHDQPEVTLQHGLPADEYFPTRTGRYAIWGEAFRDRFQERGTAPDVLRVLGAPRLDGLAAWTEDDRHDARQRTRGAWGVDDGELVVLFLSHRQSPAPLGFHEAVDAMLTEAAAGAPDLRWIVRPHPQERPGAWDARIARTSIRVDPRTPLYPAILGADLVVSPFSSTLLEGMLLGRPAVQVLPAARDRLPNYVGEAAVAETAAGLIEFGRGVQTEAGRWLREQQSVLGRWIANPGTATDQVCDYLQQL